MVVASAPTLNLLRRTTCPHCWAAFPPEEILWVASHNELLGDPRLGPEQHQRFLPSRFSVEGDALDSKGFPSTQLACPRCHLTVPRALLEMEPFFVSILGTPQSGKSYFLTSMTWELRSVLPQQFAYGFADVDTVSNRMLNDYETKLFLNPHPDELVPLADIIAKTQLEGRDLYDTVLFGDQTIDYPRPFLFALQPQEGHPNYTAAEKLARVLCLYDNAGEHFQAGMDSTTTPVTQHLAHSRLLLYMFDPTQDQRFRRACQERKLLSATLSKAIPFRQEAVLHEAAARVRRYAKLSQNAKHDRPLIVVVTKFDVWGGLLDEKDQDLSPPWMQLGKLSGLDVAKVEQRSQAVRALLKQLCPEAVAAAEGFCTQVTYVPISAMGRGPELATDPRTGKEMLAIRPRDVAPRWAPVPLLYGLCKYMPGMIPALKRRDPLAPSGRYPASGR